MRIVFVTGATATGKSKFAFLAAQKFRGVIVNCDSVQVYSGPKIGTALPPRSEREALPHYLFDCVSYPVEWTAGDYRRAFYEVVNNLPADSLVFVVGGTGFYFQAIEKGMHDSPKVSQEVSRAVLAQASTVEGLASLYAELCVKDPERAAKISANDSYRICRSIEIIRSFGKTHTEILKSFVPEKFPYPLLKVGIQQEREHHRRLIAERTRKMLAAGLREEVCELMHREGWLQWAPMQSVGYKETIEALQCGYDDVWLTEKIQTSTWQLAKRQKTWFARDSEIHSFDGESGYPAFESLIAQFKN